MDHLAAMVGVHHCISFNRIISTSNKILIRKIEGPVNDTGKHESYTITKRKTTST